MANTAFEERRNFTFRTLRGVHAWFRRRVAERARRLFWPRAYRREYTLAEIAGAYHAELQRRGMRDEG